MIERPFKFAPKGILRVGILAVGLVLASCNVARAQSAPQPLPLNIINAVDLTEAQKAQLKGYVDYWVGKLSCAAESVDVERARDELIRPLGGINQQISPSFRLEYSLLVLPPLQALMTAGCPNNQHVLPNALLVVESLSTDKAANLLLQHADIQGQKSFQLRLTAARACQVILSKGNLEPRRYAEAARKLRDAVGRETEHRIAGWHLSALNVADAAAPSDDRAKIREHFVEAVNALVKRVQATPSNPHPSPLIEPLQQAFGDLRKKFITNQISPAERPDVAKKLGWSVGQVLQIVLDNWDAAQDKKDSPRHGVFTLTVGVVESALPTLDGFARGPGKSPTTNLRKAWDAGDKATFAAETKKWLDVLAQPPYIKP